MWHELFFVFPLFFLPVLLVAHPDLPPHVLHQLRGQQGVRLGRGRGGEGGGGRWGEEEEEENEGYMFGKWQRVNSFPTGLLNL